jgi:hypothetical protein
MNNRMKMTLVVAVAMAAAAGAWIYFSPDRACVRMLASRGIERPKAEDACERTRDTVSTE